MSIINFGDGWVMAMEGLFPNTFFPCQGRAPPSPRMKKAQKPPLGCWRVLRTYSQLLSRCVPSVPYITGTHLYDVARSEAAIGVCHGLQIFQKVNQA